MRIRVLISSENVTMYVVMEGKVLIEAACVGFVDDSRKDLSFMSHGSFVNFTKKSRMV